VEKGAEPARGDPSRKFKGIVFWQGSQVEGANNDMAILSDLPSVPSSMEATKAIDAYGFSPGNLVEQADAQQAYIQSELGGAASCVPLPARGKLHRVGACLIRLFLIKALYGHRDAGGHWATRYATHLQLCVCVPVPDWRSVYRNRRSELFLAFYV